MTLRISLVVVLLAAIIATPFLLRPEGEKEGIDLGTAERVVVITPHNESIQSEFGRAFRRHMREKHGRDVYVDWRQPGGTSEIAKFLESEFTVRFEQQWKKRTGLPFSNRIREAFADRKLAPFPETEQQGWIDDPTLLRDEDDETRARAARTLFLQSSVGAGIDLFFGGGAYDFSKQAQIGNLVATDPTGSYGPGALARREPDWFSPDVMPAMVSGEPFRDADYRWVGTVLSAFGLCYNTEVVERLGFESGLTSWEDLADPRLFGQVALADPTKSGSTTKAFEMLIQEQIQKELQSRMAEARSAESIEADAVRDGWMNAMRLISRISANGRYFSDSATRVPHDVAMGDAAAGMSIDFYGRTYNEIHRDETGHSRVQFVMPRGGTSIGADPIGMLRGAPNPELADRFIEFVLSMEGQQLWNYRPGTEGGPLRFALRRPPIRLDFYTPERKRWQSDPDVNPYEIAEGFTYHGEWTGPLFSALRFVIRAACVETQEELADCWDALIRAGFPPGAMEEFDDLDRISYQRTTDEIAPVLRAGDKVAEVKLGRDLSTYFRKKYRRVEEMAKEAAQERRDVPFPAPGTAPH